MQTIIIRVAGPYTVTTAGYTIQVNGKNAIANRMAAGSKNASGEALVYGVDTGTFGDNGKPNIVGLTAQQWQLHLDAVAERRAAEKAAYRASVAGQAASARVVAERAYDQGANEGGEGFNPHRNGSGRTYARVSSRDRDYPDNA